MPQTKFVTMKALAPGLRPIVVINKVDRPTRAHQEVLNEVFDLFAALGADDDQLDFPTLFASGRSGWAAESLDAPREGSGPAVRSDRQAREAAGGRSRPARSACWPPRSNTIPIVGRILTGRIYSGIAKTNMAIKALSREGKVLEQGRLTQAPVLPRPRARAGRRSAEAGDIVAIAGLTATTVADTLCQIDSTSRCPAQPDRSADLAMTFSVNDSPLAGREGTKVTSRMIRDRLLREAEGNVAIKVARPTGGDAFEVAGRGELQLGVLIETDAPRGLRAVDRPPARADQDERGRPKLEPIEEVHGRRRRGIRGRGRREARQAPRRDDRHAPLGRGKTAHQLPSCPRAASSAITASS
jgi:GTP-binding protein